MSGINFLTALDEQKAVKTINDLEKKDFVVPKFSNPYGDGKTAKRICDIICR
jgi:UDP-N-acetylglucosamine 2-epimerase